MATKHHLNTVSRNLTSEDTSFEGVVFQAGFPILDSELNLAQASALARVRLPSGLIDTYPPKNRGETDFVTTNTPNVFGIKSFNINLLGKQLYIGGSSAGGLSNPSVNYVELPAPSTPLGLPPDITRTDFVFLEIWKAHVTASSPSRFTFVVATNNIGGLEITIDATAHISPDGQIGLSHTLIEGVDFAIGADEIETALNIANAINSAQDQALFGVNTTVRADNRGIDKLFITVSDEGETTVTPTNLGWIQPESIVAGTSGGNIPDQFSLWPNGNTQADPSLWIESEISDFDLGSNSTSRVQYQYRLRVFSADFAEGQVFDGIDPKVTFFGLEDQRILARGTQANPVVGYPFSHTSPDATSAYTFPYGDSGLFISGDGSATSAQDLGTADGYVYALPVCYVFRRNEGVFDPLNGVNNGLLSTHAGTVNGALTNGSNINIPAGVSDRPDGLFSDLISDVDILDLRRRVFLNGVDYKSELTYQFQSLLDGSNRTWAMSASELGTVGSGSGGNSSLPIVCDEFGRTGVFGGSPASGRGNLRRDLDHVCNRLSSGPVICRVALAIDGTDSQYGGAVTVNSEGSPTHDTDGWREGDEIHINLNLLDVSSALDWSGTSAVNPIPLYDLLTLGQVKGYVIDIPEVYHNVSLDGFASSQDVALRSVQGLGSDALTLTLDLDQRDCFKHPINLVNGATDVVPTSNSVSAFSTQIFLCLAVEYESGIGLSATPQGTMDSDVSVYASIAPETVSNSVVVEDINEVPDMLSGTSPHGFIREGVRELALEYVPGNGGLNDPSAVDIADRGYHEMTEVWASSADEIRLPFKVHFQEDGNNPSNYAPLVQDAVGNPVDIDLPNSTLGETNTVLKLTNAIPSPNYFTVYIHRREALPNYGGVGLRISAYYRRVAPQTCSAGYGANNASTSVTVRALAVTDKMSILQYGHGSSQSGYPYTSPTDQIGVSPAINFNESDMRGSLNVDLNGFSVGTGYAEVPSVVPQDITGELVIGGQGNAPLVDGESRLVYPMIEGGYLPSSFSQPLTAYVQHKNMTAFLAKIIDQTSAGANPVFHKGEIVLVVLSRVSSDDQNRVTISPNDSASVACIYRTRDLILTAGE